jgi:bifunctional DNase/RNase
MLIKVEANSFGVDTVRNMPVIILKEAGGSRTITVPVSAEEAQSIAIKTLKMQPDTLYMPDLLLRVIDDFGGSFEKGIIHDYTKMVFHARVIVSRPDGVSTISCRCGDAVILALRAEKSLYVEDSVFDQVSLSAQPSEQERMRRTIAGLRVLDFGRYYLG